MKTFSVYRSGAPGVECRSGGVDASHTLVFTFNRDVVSGSATITTGTGSTEPPVFSGDTMTVTLENVADVQTMVVTLTNVTSAAGGVLPSVAVQLKFLLGDTNGNSTVNASDIGQTKANSGLPITDLNFRTDTNVSGSVSASDIGQVKANAGHTLP